MITLALAIMEEIFMKSGYLKKARHDQRIYVA